MIFITFKYNNIATIGYPVGLYEIRFHIGLKYIPLCDYNIKKYTFIIILPIMCSHMNRAYRDFVNIYLIHLISDIGPRHLCSGPICK